jgi:hypothetical protein
VGHAWTPVQDDALRDAAEAGIEMEDVVDQLELPVDAIQARLAQLGLSLAEAGGGPEATDDADDPDGVEAETDAEANGHPVGADENLPTLFP